MACEPRRGRVPQVRLHQVRGGDQRRADPEDHQPPDYGRGAIVAIVVRGEAEAHAPHGERFQPAEREPRANHEKPEMESLRQVEISRGDHADRADDDEGIFEEREKPHAASLAEAQ